MKKLQIFSFENCLSNRSKILTLLVLILGFPITSLADNIGCDDAFVQLDNSALIINVTTTGVDDTANIQCALDVAVSDGYPVVRLAAGTYYIGSLLIENFKGTLQGHTRATTIIEVLDRSIDCTAMESGGLSSSVIKFVKGEPRIRFMTVRAHQPCLTVGQKISAILSFTGAPAFSGCDNDVIFGIVERVNLDGTDVVTGPDYAVLVMAEGGLVTPPTCKDTLLGTFKLNRSVISNTNRGIRTSMRSGAQVDINFNEFLFNGIAVWLVDTNQNTTITTNKFYGEATADYSAFGVYTWTSSDDAPAQTRVVIHNNYFEFGSQSSGFPAFAIYTKQTGQNTDISSVVTKNRFALSDPNTAGIWIEGTSKGHVSTNQFSGSGNHVISIWASVDNPVSGWTVAANTGIADFVSDFGADILLSTGTSQCFIGPGQNANVFDEGTDNIVLSSNSGQLTGSLPNVKAMRSVFDLTDPVEPNNPNLLAYGALSRRVGEPMDDLRETRVTPLRVDLSRVRGTGHINWSSFAGVLKSADYLKTGYLSNWPMPDREACVQPDLMIDCCSYELTEGVDGSGDTIQYFDPLDMYVDEESAIKALQEVYAQIPLHMPFTDGDVHLGAGWIYEDSPDVKRPPHGSVDYNKWTESGKDASFWVRSVAAGTVVAKYWDSWHGNVVVVEHAGPGDFTYRSFYFHLRNGKTNDINMAKTRTVAGSKDTSSGTKYLKFANLDNPNDLHWGTNNHAILVNVGDSVSAQQHIAWSGNTGPGGGGAGLNTDGTPRNSGANNHLHFMMAVSHPTWTSGEWLFVDPYGVYEQMSTGCYDLLQPTQYDRLLAPFYPYFHGVDLGVFNFYLSYYGQMGFSPATFTVQQKGNDVIAAGAFKPGLGASWHIYDYMTATDFQTQFDILTNAPNNFRLVDRSVLLNGVGQPRHNGIFRPDVINNWFSFGNQTVGDYASTFDDLTDDGYDLLDFFGYHEGSVDRIASIFAPWAGGFFHHPFLDSNTFKTVSNDHAKNGWLPVDVNVMEMANGTSLSAIYRQTGDQRMVHWGMKSAEYQQWMDFYLSSGWDLEVVQNYSDGSRYAAIWSK